MESLLNSQCLLIRHVGIMALTESTQDFLLEKGVQGSSPGAWLSQLSIAQFEPPILPETLVL